MMEQNEDDVEDMGSFDENHRFQKKIQTLPPSKQPSIPLQKKKKQISYDDLLSNMGMTLVNGKLEFNTKLQQQNVSPHPPIYQQHPQYQQQQQQQNRQPMTKQQYKKYLALEYLKQQHERNRIGEIKSKKLLFSNPNTISNININKNSPMNRLFLIRR
jgi:hypothetical protein